MLSMPNFGRSVNCFYTMNWWLYIFKTNARQSNCLACVCEKGQIEAVLSVVELRRRWKDGRQQIRHLVALPDQLAPLRRLFHTEQVYRIKLQTSADNQQLVIIKLNRLPWCQQHLADLLLHLAKRLGC